MNRIKWFDAVRSFGLFLVLIYHLFYNLLPGGFLGVDIFFTFSGFLITALILGEVQKKGGFGLFRFLKRRIRRIMLPLILMVVLTLPFALLISPDFIVGIGKQVAAALSFTFNWYGIISGASYEAQLLPQLYNHTWALAVIVQFYIAWGIICAIVVALFGRGGTDVLNSRAHKRYATVRAIVLALSVVFAVSSFIFLRYLFSSGSDLNIIYFDTLARFFPFFIGSAAAAVWGMHEEQDAALRARLFVRRRKLKTTALIIVTVLAAAAIVLMSVHYKFTDEFIYRYGFLITSALTVLLIYCTHGLHLLTPPEKKEPKALTVTAEMSYDIYLYHWPLYIIVSALIMDHTSASLVALAATLLFSVFAVYVAQRVLPARGRPNRIKHHKIAAVIVAAIAVAAIAADGVVLARVPAITSISADFAAGRIAQGTSGINEYKRGIDALDDSPVKYSEDSALQAATLPDSSITPPQSAATPTSSPPAVSPAPPASSPPSPAAPPPTASPPRTQPIGTSTSIPPSTGAQGIIGGVTVVGDSVPLGAQPAMMNTIPDCYVDAEESRSVLDGLGVIKDLQSKGELREYLVVALGTNGTDNYQKLLTEIIDGLGSGHRLIFVTPFDGRSNNNAVITNETAEWMRDLPSRYDFITIADWNAAISAQVGLLAGDKVHMGGKDSKQLYANTVADAVLAASQKPAK